MSTETSLIVVKSFETGNIVKLIKCIAQNKPQLKSSQHLNYTINFPSAF